MFSRFLTITGSAVASVKKRSIFWVCGTRLVEQIEDELLLRLRERHDAIRALCSVRRAQAGDDVRDDGVGPGPIGARTALVVEALHHAERHSPPGAELERRQRDVHDEISQRVRTVIGQRDARHEGHRVLDPWRGSVWAEPRPLPRAP